MVSFVILHYKAIDDTIECIESISKHIMNPNYNIIVVDNGSNDGSGEKLSKLYSTNEKVSVIINEENAGFANGNNIGCRYAVSHNSPDFLVVLNNDTIVDQDDFIDKIFEEYKIYDFDMLGPDIITLDEVHQNPTTHYSKSLNHIKKRILKLQLFYIIARTGFFTEQLIIKKKAVQPERFNEEYKFRAENVPLHGSAIIFSRKYYEKFRNVFYEKTYMYCEEDILYHRSKLHNLKTVYTPEIRIKHKEDISTNLLYSSSVEKELFVIKNTIKSLKALRKMIESTPEN